MLKFHEFTITFMKIWKSTNEYILLPNFSESDNNTSNQSAAAKLRLESGPRVEMASVSDPHPDCSNVSSKVKFIKNSSSRGWHSIAEEDIEAGEVLFVDKPLAWFLAGTRWASNCHHCCQPLCYTLVPSPLQPNIIFCCIECCYEAMRSYHVQEAKLNLR